MPCPALLPVVQAVTGSSSAASPAKKARPMKPEWVENVKVQCDTAAVAFFFKQWGAWGADGRKRSKHANGRRYRGKVWNRIPEAVHV
jgi:protein gp37